MIRIIAKLFVAIVFTTLLHIGPLAAQASPIAFLANNGTGTQCTSAAPCSHFSDAIPVVQSQSGGEIICLDSTALFDEALEFVASMTIDCHGLYLMSPSTRPALELIGTNQVMKIRNLTFNGIRTSSSAIFVTGSGTLILENCVFEDFGTGTALDIEPAGPLNLVIKNSRISNNASGVLIKPAAGGSVTATFDGLTIADNSGGGLKTDTTNGTVTIDITDSVVSKNGGNGINAIGATNQNMVSIKNSVITKNAVAGVQANGALVGVLVQTTLFDQNATGATSVVGGGHISTYGNNSIVGSSGSGFTGTASLQ
jgi:hypothetical protein